MEFGKLSSVDNVKFNLPADHPDTQAVLDSLPATTPTLRIGLPRWADKALLGELYAKGTKQAEFLREYSRHFETVELNSTYYGVQRNSIEKWATLTPPTFRFCPKFPGAITHERTLVNAEAETESFFEALDLFGDRCGPAWMLLPNTFGPRDLPVLDRYLTRFASRRPLAVELRHEGWFRDPEAGRAAFDLLESHTVIAMLTDVAGRRDVLHQRLTTDTLMLRFVGNRHHPTDFTRIDAWIDRLTTWFTQGLHTTYIFLHQPEEHLNVRIATHLTERLPKELPALAPSPPQKVEQRSLF